MLVGQQYEGGLVRGIDEREASACSITFQILGTHLKFNDETNFEITDRREKVFGYTRRYLIDLQWPADFSGGSIGPLW